MNLVNVIKRIQDFEADHPHQAGQASFYRKAKATDQLPPLVYQRNFYYIVQGSIVHKLDGEDVWFSENPNMDMPEDAPEVVIETVRVPFSIDDLTANDWVWEV